LRTSDSFCQSRVKALRRAWRERERGRENFARIRKADRKTQTWITGIRPETRYGPSADPRFQIPLQRNPPQRSGG